MPETEGKRPGSAANPSVTRKKREDSCAGEADGLLYVIAMIDPAARERLTQLRRLAAPFGIPPRDLHGHITLAAYAGEDEGRFIASCKAVLARYGQFSVAYDKIELFASTSAVVAAPRKEGPLDAIQREITERWAADLDQWTRRDVWRPHTTLAYHPTADLGAVAGAMRAEFEPFAARVERVEFSREFENRYEIIDSIKLA